MTRKRKFGFAFLFSFFALILGLGIGELYIRWFIPIDEDGRYELTDNPVLFYRLTAGARGVDLGARFTQTRQHTRGPQVFEQTPPPGIDRILWLGDSACYGVRVADEETAPFQLGEIAAVAGAEVESINLGVVGYNVRQVREVFEQRSKEFTGAKAIVYYHHENDIVNATWVAMAPHMPAGLQRDYERPQSEWKKLLKRSALIHRLGRTKFVASVLGIPPPDIQQLSANGSSEGLMMNPFSRLCLSLYSDENRLGRQFRDELFVMNNRAKALGARFIVAYWPTPTVGGHPELDHIRGTLRRWCNLNDIEFVDATEAFLAASGPDLYADTSHPGVRGHRIVADAVWNTYRAGQTKRNSNHVD